MMIRYAVRGKHMQSEDNIGIQGKTRQPDDDNIGCQRIT
jgi:hypothetical protein